VKFCVLSPHSGDAAYALGLMIEGWLSQGHAVDVVNCFTRSDFAPYSDAQSLHPNDRISFVTAVRRREDEAWRKLYGVAKLKLTDLNLKDATLRLHCAPEDVYGRPSDTSEKVAAKIGRAIEASKADALVLPLGVPVAGTAQSGAHVDYVSARDAAAAVWAASRPVAFYEELPHSLGASADAIETAVHGVEVAVGTRLQETFGSGGDPERTAEAAVQRRRRFALCYDSQIDDAMTSEIARLGARHDGRERLWSNAAWREALSMA
jgi:LmbE family N-acetylglucosaminyl deacetylase